MIQPSELQILILAVALTPLMAWAYRGIVLPGKGWLALAITSTMGSYILTVAEGFIAPELMNFGEHLLYAAAGVFFAGAAVMLWRAKPLFEPGDSE